MQFRADSPRDDVSVTKTMGRSSVEISTPRESVLRNPTACASDGKRGEEIKEMYSPPPRFGFRLLFCRSGCIFPVYNPTDNR